MNLLRRMFGPLLSVLPSLYVVYFVSLIHLVWAALLIDSPAAAHSTPVAAIISLLGSRAAAIAALAGTALLTQFVFWLHHSPKHPPVQPRLLAVSLIPQQFLLFISAAGGIAAAVQGHYADGVPRPWQFIVGDQFPVIALAILYTTAILVIARDKRT